MKRPPLRVELIPDTGDSRGSSFTLPDAARMLGTSVKDIHVMTLRPSCVRGNHFHAEKHERILVVHSDKWSLHWDTGPHTAVAHRTFHGAGAALIQVEPFAAHAIRNDGTVDLWIVDWSECEFDPARPDIHRRVVAS